MKKPKPICPECRATIDAHEEDCSRPPVQMDRALFGYEAMCARAEESIFGRVQGCGCIQYRGASDAKTPNWWTVVYCGDHDSDNPPDGDGENPLEHDLQDFG